MAHLPRIILPKSCIPPRHPVPFEAVILPRIAGFHSILVPWIDNAYELGRGFAKSAWNCRIGKLERSLSRISCFCVTGDKGTNLMSSALAEMTDSKYSTKVQYVQVR